MRVISIVYASLVSFVVQGKLNTPRVELNFLEESNVEETNGFDFCKVVNDRPIVGVFTQDARGVEMIAGDYIKYIEMSGARVVALRYKSTEAELRKQFDSINGVLFPGGGANLTPGHPLFDSANKIFNWAIEANQKGDFFPIWGTCLGFELLNVLAAGNNATVLTGGGLYDAEDYPTPVTFTKLAKESKLFRYMPRHLVEAIQVENITQNSHNQGVDPEIFNNNKLLSDFFSNLANFKDRKGKPFVVAIEAKNGLPIYGTQFHPEKPLFSWIVPSKIPHTPNAVALGQYFSDFFVTQARCSSHKFEGGYEEEAVHLIQSTAKHVIVPTGYFSEIYTFSNTTK